MNLPGFTADASIYRNKGQYQMVRSSVSLSGKTGVYQSGSIKPAAHDCGFNCVMCAYIRDPRSRYCKICTGPDCT